MKILRYLFIAALLYAIASVLPGFISPPLHYLDGSAVESGTLAAFASIYRQQILPWLLLAALLLIGWYFIRQRVVAWLILITATPLLAYLGFTSIRKLGYTMDQSLLALTQGQGTFTVAWMIFHGITIIALLVAVLKKEPRKEAV